jgi:hypothetical protein
MNEEEMKQFVLDSAGRESERQKIAMDEIWERVRDLSDRQDGQSAAMGNMERDLKSWVRKFMGRVDKDRTAVLSTVQMLRDQIADMPTKEWTNQLILKIIDFQKHEPKDSDYVPFDDVDATDDLKKTMEIADRMHEAVREGREPLILEEYTDAQKPPEAWMKKFMEIAEMGDKLKQSPEIQKAQARAANFLKFMHTVPDPLFRQFLDFDPAKLDDYVPPKAWGNFDSPEADRKIKDFMDARRVQGMEKEIEALRAKVKQLMEEVRPMRDSMPTTIRVERVPATKAEVIAYAGDRCDQYQYGCATCAAWDSWDRTGTLPALWRHLTYPKRRR